MEVANFCAAMDTLIDQDGLLLTSARTLSLRHRKQVGTICSSTLCPSDTRNYMNYSFLPRTIVQWNKLPDPAVVTSPSLDTYREGYADSLTVPLSLLFLLCTTNIHTLIFMSSPSQSFLFLLHPYFHSTSTHTF